MDKKILSDKLYDYQTKYDETLGIGIMLLFSLLLFIGGFKIALGLCIISLLFLFTNKILTILSQGLIIEGKSGISNVWLILTLLLSSLSYLASLIFAWFKL